jgi:hypothetical protein
MAASENSALRFNKRLMGTLFAICAVVFVIGLIVLPFATAIRLIGLAAIVAVPYLIALLKLDSSRHGPIAVLIVIMPGIALVPRIAGETNRLLNIVFYCMTVSLIALPLLFFIRQRWPNVAKRAEPSVQA